MDRLYPGHKRPNPVKSEYEKGASYYQKVFKGVKTLWYSADFYGVMVSLLKTANWQVGISHNHHTQFCMRTGFRFLGKEA